jgi:hypothetical protein
VNGPEARPTLHGRGWAVELARAGVAFEPIGTVRACTGCGEPVRRVDLMALGGGADWVHCKRQWCGGPERPGIPE